MGYRIQCKVSRSFGATPFYNSPIKVSHLDEFSAACRHAGEHPDAVPDPVSSGFLCEATMRSRLGVDAISVSWSHVVAERLEVFGVESMPERITQER